MAHLPVNHPGRPFYRALAGLIGLYILVFGIAGYLQTRDLPFFEQGEFWTLGLRTNPAFSVLSVLAGAVLLGGTLYGRNLDHLIYLGGSVVFLVAGLVMMTLLNTGANLLNFAMANVVVSFVIGLALLLAGLFGKVGSPEYAAAEEQLRQGERGGADPHPPPGRRVSERGGSPGRASPPDGTVRSRPD